MTLSRELQQLMPIDRDAAEHKRTIAEQTGACVEEMRKPGWRVGEGGPVRRHEFTS
jgi:hypothetical protein